MPEKIFFIVGAQRSGTSYLYNILDQHPEIRMAKPAIPEPKYFLNSDSLLHSKEFYFKKYFANAKEKIFGEKSTSYLESAEAGNRIKKLFPDAKIILVLRNPVYRAISNYFYSKSNGLEFRSVESALMKTSDLDVPFPTSVSPFKYLERGHYAKFIKKYFEIFERENVNTVFLSQVSGNLKEIRKMYEFVGADSDFVPQNIYEKVNWGNNIPEIDKEISDYLQNYYKPYNQELETLLSVQLKEWEK